MTSKRAVRATVSGHVQGVGFRDATRRRASELGVMGWVRNEQDRAVHIHAEGDADAVAQLLAFLEDGPPLAEVEGVDVDEVRVEGHEQFAIRGVSAGAFVVQEHTQGASARFTLSLEVDAAMRTWALPKGPSLDPAVKRFAIELDGSATAGPGGEQATGAAIWDRGAYEQGGRVPWPQALDRGHAVFVLHGEKLRGGFALQRTRAAARPQWLLIKRRDEHARPGSDVLAERPEWL